MGTHHKCAFPEGCLPTRSHIQYMQERVPRIPQNGLLDTSKEKGRLLHRPVCEVWGC